MEGRAILNAIVKLVSRVFMPGLAREMAREGQFDFREDAGGGVPDPKRYIQVEDNGSDVTIVSFAGMAVLFAGMPQFEFRKVLKGAAEGCNLVFVRDPRRTFYCLAPDGTSTGAAFYGELVREALEKLGSRYNIAMGASAGGAAAFFLGSRLPIHQVIAFSPGFPPRVYLDWRTQLNTYFNVWRLLRDPGAYFEVVLVTLGGGYIYRRVRRLLGGQPIADITAVYLGIEPEPPRATVFYGERCVPDRNQARLLAHIPQVTIRPIATGRHNCAGVLRQEGRLAEALREEIDAGLAAWRAGEAREAG